METQLIPPQKGCGAVRSPRAEPPVPNFQPVSIVAKTAGWIKIALGMEVGLGPGHIVLDGDQAAFPKKGT